MTDNKNLLIERRECAQVIFINRPRRLNALNIAVLEELESAVKDAAAGDARAVIITGAGEKAFAAGADIAAMRDFLPADARRFAARAHDIFAGIEALPLPVIAAVNGYALGGGCELALACDWIICSSKTIFGQPEAALGVIPGFGGSQRLPRLVGRAFALEMICTGRQIPAAEALARGLVTKICEPENLLEEALHSARQIASQGPLAVAAAKRAVMRGASLDLQAACKVEEEIFTANFAAPEQREGMSAFLEKRKPEWNQQK
jgi:enoyl-CoA hydratase